MSQGILQHAVTGAIPLQLEYVSRSSVLPQQESAVAEALNQLNQSLDDEFGCLLEMI